MKSLAERPNKAFGRYLAHCPSDLGWWIAEASFVAGWSLMWASALRIIEWMPIPVCLLLMLFGAGLPGIFHRPPVNSVES